MTTIKFVDTTIRDGQASIWAMNMRTKHMTPMMADLDLAGFEGVEFIATGSRLKKFVRHLGENPWDWIKQGAAAMNKTELRWHGQIDGSSMSGFVPAAIGELLVEKAVALGIRYTRTGNNWNNFAAAEADVKRLVGLGMTPVLNIIYSVSPRHTDEYFVQKTKEAAKVAPYRLCLKDVGGLLTPDRIRELVPKMLAVSGDIEWEFHGHCNNGLGPLNAIECAKLGISYLHAAIPPLANGNSQPNVFTLAGNLRELGFDVDVNLDPLRNVSSHLFDVARNEDLPIGTPYEFDSSVYQHQVPGGMRSNLRFQLRQAGQENRFEEVLEEAGRVRKEFGYPIMVTPLAQFVGSQAALNVLVGERYAQVSDQTIEYALGRHGGHEAIEGMDPDVRAKILDRPRVREIETFSHPQPTLSELRHRYGETISDEDLILRVIVGDDAVEAVSRPRADSAGQSISELLGSITSLDRPRMVYFQNREVTIKAGRTSPK